MELKEFVQSALVEVVEAVGYAQAELIDNGDAVINPRIYADNITKTQNQQHLHLVEGTGRGGVQSVYYAVQSINFDVAVSISDTTKTGGGGRISVIAASLGGQASDEMQTTSISRIKFSVPILFPKLSN